MTQRNTSDDQVSVADLSEKKVYEKPVFSVLDTDATASGGPGVVADATNSS